MRSSSGQLTRRDTTVALSGIIERGQVTSARSADAPMPQGKAKPAGRVPRVRSRTGLSPQSGVTQFALAANLNRAQAPYTLTTTKRAAKPSGSNQKKSADDPNKGRYGRKPERGGFHVDAVFRPGSNRNWVTVLLTVTAEAGANLELGDVAVFDLHPTFPQRRIKVMFNDRRATLSVQAGGGFTLGVELPRQGIKLERDLAEMEDAPNIIKTR